MSGRLPLVTKALLPHTQTSTILFRAHTIIIIGPLGHNSVRNTSPALVVRGETANVTRSIIHTFSPEQVVLEYYISRVCGAGARGAGHTVHSVADVATVR